MDRVNKIYLGVYGLYIKDGAILMVKKGRGPYIGLYDLPGGGLDFEEKIEECLKREIKEETGAMTISYEFICNNEYFCTDTKDNLQKDFHHIGIYYSVDLSYESLKVVPDGEDSLGSIFVPIKDLNRQNTSPISYSVIKKYGKKIWCGR